MEALRAGGEHRSEPAHAGRVEDPQTMKSKGPARGLPRAPLRRHGEDIPGAPRKPLDASVIRAERIGEPRHAVAEPTLEPPPRADELLQGCPVRKARQSPVGGGVRADLDPSALEPAQQPPRKEAWIAVRGPAGDHVRGRMHVEARED